MNRHQQTGWVFVLVAVVFVVLGMSTDAGSPVVWFVLAGAFAVVGADELRRGGSREGQRPSSRRDRAS